MASPIRQPMLGVRPLLGAVRDLCSTASSPFRFLLVRCLPPPLRTLTGLSRLARLTPTARGMALAKPGENDAPGPGIGPDAAHIERGYAG
jgi:hypothetical protein